LNIHAFSVAWPNIGGVAEAALGPAAPDGATRPALRGVIIDWGGVLTNPITETVGAWLAADGIDRDRYAEVMRPWIIQAYVPPAAGTGSRGNPIHALERGECLPEEFERLLATQLVRVDGGPVPAEGLLHRMWAATTPVPAMYELLRTLRRAGIRTCLLSNSWGSSAYPRHEFPELFDAVVISAEVGMRKPEERIFLHAAGLLGLPPAQCVFIDDIEANVAAAVTSGMTGVHHSEPGLTAARLSDLLGFTPPRPGPD
jgi:putative hydrolase of the HAD superfamily